MTATRPTSLRTLLSAAAVLSVLALSACGGSSTPGGTSSAAVPAASASATAGAGAGGAADFTAYRSCLADNGVTLPDMGARPSGAPSGMPSGMPSGAPGGSGGLPGGLPDGVDQATFDAATAACADLAPQGGPGADGGPQIDATALAAYKSCLADHQVTVPDGDGWMAALDRTDATVKAAMDTCAALLPAPTASPAAGS